MEYHECKIISTQMFQLSAARQRNFQWRSCFQKSNIRSTDFKMILLHIMTSANSIVCPCYRRVSNKYIKLICGNDHRAQTSGVIGFLYVDKYMAVRHILFCRAIQYFIITSLSKSLRITERYERRLFPCHVSIAQAR